MIPLPTLLRNYQHDGPLDAIQALSRYPRCSIVGGALIRLIRNEPFDSSDVDVFVRNSSDADHARSILSDLGYRFFSDNKTAYKFATTITYRNKTGWLVQVVILDFDGVEDLFRYVDLTICQVASRDQFVLLTETAERDIQDKRLVGNRLFLKPSRVRKYRRRGYRFSLRHHLFSRFAIR